MMIHTLMVMLALQLTSNGVAVPHGGGGCSSDWDCSLGGQCVLTPTSRHQPNSSGCKCAAYFTGSHCALLNLQRAKVENGFDLNATSTSTWGGHAVTAEPNSTAKGWVGHFSLITGQCTLGAYRTNSESVAGGYSLFVC